MGFPDQSNSPLEGASIIEHSSKSAPTPWWRYLTWIKHRRPPRLHSQRSYPKWYLPPLCLPQTPHHPLSSQRTSYPLPLDTHRPSPTPVKTISWNVSATFSVRIPPPELLPCQKCYCCCAAQSNAVYLTTRRATREVFNNGSSTKQCSCEQLSHKAENEPGATLFLICVFITEYTS